MLVNCAFTAGFLLFGRRRKNLLLSATAAAVALQVGIFLNPGALTAGRQAVLMQANAPILNTAWPEDLYQQTMSELGQLSKRAAPPNPPGEPGLIVFPESPAPFWVTDARFRTWLANIARDTNSYLIVGSLGSTETRDEQGQHQLLNSALIVDPQGNAIGRYDKIHLVPFGEYVPFKSLLFFADKLTREVGDFARGTERKVFDLDGMKAGVIICYESIFPDEVREFAANGAQVFVNISDDGWYGETSAPFQHLQMARMRAIENQRWILLSTNNGVTASIDPLGRVVKKAERNIRTALVAPFAPQSETTFYSRYGDLFAWICVIISLIVLFVRFRIAGRTMLEARSAP
jgi:apolipoprotein N-acyltransferase